MKKDKTKGFFKVTVIFMIANLLAKVIGMLREVFLAKYYGAGMYTDAYVIANNIPIIIFGSIGVALASSFIPIYSEANEKEGRESALKFTNNVTSILLILCTLIFIFGEIFTKPMVSIFAVGFQGETLNYAVQFSRILMPCIFAMALMNISSGFLQVNGEFKVMGYVSIPSNIIIVISTILSYKFNNIYILVFGTLIGTFSQLLYYYPFIKRNGFNFKFNINLKNVYIRRMGVIIIPVILGEAVNEVNKIIDKTLVSGLDEGSISSLNYADKLIGVFTGVFILTLITMIYPKLSKLISAEKHEEFRKLLVRFINGLVIFIVPVTGIIIILSPLIVKVVFERGTFDMEAARMTYEALDCYAVGLIGIALRDILIKVFFCLKDTKTPMINGIICSALNIVLSIILIKVMGHKGAALATSIVSIISALRLMYLVVKKIKGVSFKNSMVVLVKSLIAAIVPVVALSIVFNNYIMTSSVNIFIKLLEAGAVSGAALIVYIAIMTILKCTEVEEGISFIIKKQLGKGKNR